MDVILFKIGITCLVVMLPIFGLHCAIEKNIGYYMLKNICIFLIGVLVAMAGFSFFIGIIEAMWG